MTVYQQAAGTVEHNSQLCHPVPLTDYVQGLVQVLAELLYLAEQRGCDRITLPVNVIDNWLTEGALAVYGVTQKG